MDYFGMPRIQSHLRPIHPVLDLQHNLACTPGDGNAQVAMTLTRDAARYVAAAVEMETWSRASLVIGSQISVNELLELARRVRYPRKLDVSYVPIRTLLNYEAPLLPSNKSVALHFSGGEKSFCGSYVVTWMLPCRWVRMILPIFEEQSIWSLLLGFKLRSLKISNHFCLLHGKTNESTGIQQENRSRICQRHFTSIENRRKACRILKYNAFFQIVTFLNLQLR